MRSGSFLLPFGLCASSLLLAGGCTQVLGIDGDYHLTGGGGTTASGGSGAEGGSQAGGGSGGQAGGGLGGTGGGGAQPNGSSCSQGGQCLSSFCVDDRCCDSACGALCMACSGALTGGEDGVCGNVTAGTDPGSECPGTHNCAGNGACD